MTSFKYIWMFYAIEYAIVLLIYIMVAAITGDPENAGTNCLEMNTFIYVGILGALGYSEDFKMMIQNGFTRKYIFVATLSMFAFIRGIMSLADTVAGNLLHYFAPDYNSLFGVIYGYDDILPNWIWLFLLYMLIGSLFYLTALAIHKLKKTLSLCLIAVPAGIILLAVALFRYVLPQNLVDNIRELASRAMGFMNGGTVNYLSPSSERRIQKLSGLPFFCPLIRKFPSQFLIRQKERGALMAKKADDSGQAVLVSRIWSAVFLTIPDFRKKTWPELYQNTSLQPRSTAVFTIKSLF